MSRADENLRIGAPSVGAPDHLFANVPFSSDVDFMVAHTFARKELLGVLAKGAVLDRINIDFGHDRSKFLAKSYMDVRAGSATLAKNQHIDIGGSGAQQRPRTAVDSGPRG